MGKTAVEAIRPDVARWLVGGGGSATLRAVERQLASGTDVLQVGAQLRRELPPERAAAALAVATTRQRAAAVDRQLGSLLLTPVGLEQSSHPAVSAWRAQRFAGAGPVVDLCAGAGVDAVTIAAVASGVVAVERDETRAVLAQRNAAIRDVRVAVVVGDARRPPVDVRRRLVHVDPSRRGDTRRARRLAHYRPGPTELREPLAGAHGVAWVVSPGVDLADPDLPDGELEFVQVGPALTEAVVWSGALATPGAAARATVLGDGGAVTRTRGGAPVELPSGSAGEWLLEPAPAAVRARLHGELGAEADARRLSTRVALLTAERAPAPSPWWRAWVIEAVLPPRARAVGAWLRTAEELPVEFATHGVTIDVDGFWRACGRPPRGPSGRWIHLVRHDEGARAYVCREV